MALEKNLKTPPESDPRKENRNGPPGIETSPAPGDFEDGTVKPINEETPAVKQDGHLNSF
jgi:hypothetical protein